MTPTEIPTISKIPEITINSKIPEIAKISKVLRVKKSKEFQIIGKKGQKFYSKTVLLLSHPTSQTYFNDVAKGQNAERFFRAGYTVSKKIGNAVARNYAKRRLREAFREISRTYAKNHHDYIMIARKEIVDADLKKIISDLKFCLKRIHSEKNKSAKRTN